MKNMVLQYVFRVALAIMAGSAACMVLVPMAMKERGYWAIGGEWVGVIFAAMLTFILSKKLLEKNLEEEERMRK